MHWCNEYNRLENIKGQTQIINSEMGVRKY